MRFPTGSRDLQVADIIKKSRFGAGLATSESRFFFNIRDLEVARPDTLGMILIGE